MSKDEEGKKVIRGKDSTATQRGRGSILVNAYRFAGKTRERKKG